MAARPVIGVTGAHGRFSPSWFCSRLAVWLAGGRPLRISIRHPGEPDKLDAMIIGGGDDIDPALYGGEGPAQNTQRDNLEIRYIQYALDNHVPLLGICRGAQLLNAVLGGSLYSNIRDMRRHTSNRRQILPLKNVALEPASRVAAITGRQHLKVNSLHYQAMKGIAPSLTVAGRDRDNFVQAVETHPPTPPPEPDHRQPGPDWLSDAANSRLQSRDGEERLPPDEQKAPSETPWAVDMIGVQWHPEYLWYLPSQLALFRWLVATARHD